MLTAADLLTRKSKVKRTSVILSRNMNTCQKTKNTKQSALAFSSFVLPNPTSTLAISIRRSWTFQGFHLSSLSSLPTIAKLFHSHETGAWCHKQHLAQDGREQLHIIALPCHGMASIKQLLLFSFIWRQDTSEQSCGCNLPTYNSRHTIIFPVIQEHKKDCLQIRWQPIIDSCAKRIRNLDQACITEFISFFLHKQVQGCHLSYSLDLFCAPSF